MPAFARRALGHDLSAGVDQARDIGAAAKGDEINQRMADLEARLKRLPFLDEVDLRYRYRVAVAAPSARAVMFCLMDVSASMDERKKDLAKRFFTLLYLFLTRKYERVELIFIRSS